MITFLSLVTATKDYFEIVHKLIEFNPNYTIVDYQEFGSIFSYIILTVKNLIAQIFSLNWLHNLWNWPILIPDISSSMISEISIFDKISSKNILNYLETPLGALGANNNASLYTLEKFLIGLVNSCFLILPTSAAHIIMLRRFIFQGLEAGYLAGLGTLLGNIFFISSIIFGCRFFIIPWLSLDIFRYLLGFVILIKFMWHASNDTRKTSSLNNLAKSKILLLNFLLALTEQTSIFPFLSNLSISPESSILETFPVTNFWSFIFIHLAYILGLFAGSLSLLHLTCWLWENPLYKLYLWFISMSNLDLFKGSQKNYYKYLNFFFLYVTMLCSLTSIPYFGLDYTVTNPLGLVFDDRILYQNNKKTNQSEFPEFGFLNTQASNKNNRDSRGRHGRRERWKDRLIKYRGMDTSLYEQSIYDLLTIEDLNYGFDKFWLRRKIKNHHSRFRMIIFQPWLLSLKKQLAKPLTSTRNSSASIGTELFRMLYEQFYHPVFHSSSVPLLRKYNLNQSTISFDYKNIKDLSIQSEALKTTSLKSEVFSSENLSLAKKQENSLLKASLLRTQANTKSKPNLLNSLRTNLPTESKGTNTLQQKLIIKNSILRKFVRKLNTRIQSNNIVFNSNFPLKSSPFFGGQKKTSLYSIATSNSSSNVTKIKRSLNLIPIHLYRVDSTARINYKTLIFNKKNYLNNKFSTSETKEFNNSKVMLHPIKYYLQKEKAFKRKLKFYGANIYRKFSLENNAPFFRIMMRRLFYYYKPTLRWTNTLKLAKNKQAHKVRRKKARKPLIFHFSSANGNFSEVTSTKNNFFPETSPNLLTNSEWSNKNNSNVALINPRHKENLAKNLDNSFPNLRKSTGLEKKPTHNYRIIGKQSSRYRYQIYKDVLKHWYYTPFNRLLLKFDIDSFIRRQPKSHFLTKSEEQELHLKRFLLTKHYETLRWYTVMQHYQTMKTNIGGTKSFANRFYNHQFQGTLKKIRHLFSITPEFKTKSIVTSTEKKGKKEKQTSGTYNEGLLNLTIAHQNIPILKYDQPLYNEYFNTEKQSFINHSMIHEELRSNYLKPSLETTPNNLPLIAGVPANLNNKKGQETEPKVRLLKNKFYKNKLLSLFFIPTELKEKKKLASARLSSLLINSHFNNKQNSWFKFFLLKNYKKNLYDQEFLTKFFERRIKKKEKRQQKKEKLLKARLTKIKQWLAPNLVPLMPSLSLFSRDPIFIKKKKEDQKNNQNNMILSSALINNSDYKFKSSALTTGIKNAISDGYLILNPSHFFWPPPKKKANLFSFGVSPLKSEAFKGSSTSFVKMRILKDLIFIQFKNLGNISRNFIKKKVFKALQSPSSLYNWELKEKTLKKRKRSRKKYIKEIKKTQNTYLTSLKEQKKKNNIFSQSVIKPSSSAPLLRKLLKNLFGDSKKISFLESVNQKSMLEKDLKNYNSLLKRKKEVSNFQNSNFFSSNFFLATPFFGPQKKGKKKQLLGLKLPINFQKKLLLDFNNLKVKKRETKFNQALLAIFFKGSKKEINKASKICFSRKKTKSRRNQRYGRPHHRIEHPTFIADLERKNANMVAEARFNQIKQQKSLPNNRIFNVLLEQKKKKAKKHTWKKFKKGINNEKLRKAKKFNVETISLQRTNLLIKKVKNLKLKLEFQEWWWKQFTPIGSAHKDHLNSQVSTKIKPWLTSSPFIFQRKTNNVEYMQTNNNFIDSHLKYNKEVPSLGNLDFLKAKLLEHKEINWQLEKERQIEKKIATLSKKDLLEQEFETLSSQTEKKKRTKKSFLSPTNNLPFYAGWDESLRKFVLTNRLLSRREAGFIIPSTEINLNLPNFAAVTTENFTNTLQGMNAGTTLYCQLPFTTFDPDQLFSKGMDGFAPIGWTRFNFTNTILKTPLLESNSFVWDATGQKKEEEKLNRPNGLLLLPDLIGSPSLRISQNLLFLKKRVISLDIQKKEPKIETVLNKNFKLALAGQLSFNLANYNKKIKSKESQKYNNYARRIKKHYKQIKKSQNEKVPVFLISGALVNQVLPINYINAFTKQNRLSRDRYLKRRFRRAKKNIPKTIKEFNGKNSLISQRNNFIKKVAKQNKAKNIVVQFNPFHPKISNFTLRKRLKSRRKYHRKPLTLKNIEIRPRRHKFFVKYQKNSLPIHLDHHLKASLLQSVNNIFSLGFGVPEKRRTIKKDPKNFETNTKNVGSVGLDLIENVSKSNKLFRKRPSKRSSKKNREFEANTSKNRKKLQKITGLNSRLRQLRRRISRQVVQPIPRRQPRNGGFLWPGDYLRLEQTESPKLFLNPSSRATGSPEKSQSTKEQTQTINPTFSGVPRKIEKKSILLDLYVQPRQYLLEKHNIKLLKKKILAQLT